MPERLKITLRPHIPPPDKDSSQWEKDLHSTLTVILNDYADALDRLTTGRVRQYREEYSAKPTSGLYTLGDFVPKQDQAISGSAGFLSGAKYIVTGYVCKNDGSASASSFVEMRVITDE